MGRICTIQPVVAGSPVVTVNFSALIRGTDVYFTGARGYEVGTLGVVVAWAVLRLVHTLVLGLVAVVDGAVKGVFAFVGGSFTCSI